MTRASTYGLIFLSRYTVSERVKSDETECRHVWFANQVSSQPSISQRPADVVCKTSTFSCATVALMNVINNRPDVQLGDTLEHFRSSTKDLSSKDRGLALDDFEHVRKAHNSFAS